jgi:hypothetical protein
MALVVDAVVGLMTALVLALIRRDRGARDGERRQRGCGDDHVSHLDASFDRNRRPVGVEWQ